jgi:hypothetical protein
MTLLPCPFCGKTEYLQEEVFASCEQRIWCANCMCIGPLASAGSEEEAEVMAAGLWNTRPGGIDAWERGHHTPKVPFKTWNV